MQRTFALLAPVLFVGALAVTATLSAQDKPTEAPVKPTAQPAAETAAQTPAGDASAAASAFPSAASILERSVVAIGGKEAWSKINSVETKGELEVPGQGLKGPMVSLMAKPNRNVTSMTFAGIGSFRTGFDGTVGWSIDSISGPRLLTEGELETIKREADLMRYADPMKTWDKIETVGEGDFNGFACWKLVGQRGESTSTLWFEKESGLQRGLEMSIDTQMGKIPVSTTMREYKEFTGAFGAVKFPVRTEATQMGQKMVTTIESAVFDAAASNAFELPTEIKALLEPEPSDDLDTDAEPAAPAAPATPAAPTTPAAPATPASPKSNS
jgi:hypothetical protein